MATKKITITTVTPIIPQDLIFEILLKLPAKSVLRFISVSKSWMSIIINQHFIDSFMSLSLSRPRLLLLLSDFDDGRVLFFSSPHQICPFLSSSSKLVAAEKNMPEVNSYGVSTCTSVRGFVFYRHLDGFVVCNPTTGQFINLANNVDTCCYLGYDPNSNQYKVLRVMPDECLGNEHSVLTLGGQGSSPSWRSIKANIPGYYKCYQNSVCIDGVVYYRCRKNDRQAFCCFDVGSEQLRFITIPGNLAGILVNYLGKLAVYYVIKNGFILWVLDDVNNQVWSKKYCVFPSSTYSGLMNFRFVGTTAFGEMVFASRWTGGFYELFCYDVEKKMERRIRIEELPEDCRLYPFLLCSHVENINYL